jgi:hypothetical protein
MEDDLKKMKTTSKFHLFLTQLERRPKQQNGRRPPKKIEDDLKNNRRRPKKNGKRPLKKMEDYLKKNGRRIKKK